RKITLLKTIFMQPKSIVLKSIIPAILFLALSITNVNAQSTKPSDDYFAIENFYKVKWGLADEFINLWKANHYPLLKKAMEKGDIISIQAEKPKLHSGEDTRWDFKVILVFKNEKTAFDPDLTTP